MTIKMLHIVLPVGPIGDTDPKLVQAVVDLIVVLKKMIFKNKFYTILPFLELQGDLPPNFSPFHKEHAY